MRNDRLTHVLLVLIAVLLLVQNVHTYIASKSVQPVEIYLGGSPVGDGLRARRGHMLPVDIVGPIDVRIVR